MQYRTELLKDLAKQHARKQSRRTYDQETNLQGWFGADKGSKRGEKRRASTVLLPSEVGRSVR